MSTYLSVSQAAEKLGVSRSSVSYYIRKALLPTVEVAGRRVIEAKAVEAFERPSPASKHQTVRSAIARDKSLTEEQRDALHAILDQ